ncbi:tyrosine--tRNA ligase [Candidatus Shapirobacteria bacterium CG09_land_8_20_14_0_10_38_17]|uniref:tyrosine--tRNA ligase n=1 Tax=Candidatus Shapirobacteria bacterium CG09_land_8_20_14_0_10_38_17 TaxID=1974884 RepID=A0A2H0WR72_9BACT|nr:MAG: tyrosine--tRNA ligase [Candidatus Shapirobacteria bacterium CG09_land_8_20_14_0_10_38_17]
MDTKTKLNLLTRNTQEVLTEKDLKNLLEGNEKLRHYIGFEISGKVHLGTGLMCMGKVADFLKAGVECNVFLADWHTYINNKLDGNWDHIIQVARDYFQEAMEASLECFGVKSGAVNFILASDLYKDTRHWQNLMEVSKNVTLSRVKRSVTIAGKKEGEAVDFATLIYPPLQVADIFTLGVNLAQAAIDQRKAHVVARAVAKKLTISPLLNKKGEKIAPVAIHHNFLLSLVKPSVWPVKRDMEKDIFATAFKMSKSKPNSAIFIHDSPEEIREKVDKAFCPPQVSFNPILNWTKYLVFWGQDEGEFRVVRAAKFGGNKTYYSYRQLEGDYKNGRLHPQDLKTAVADWLIVKLAPARRHFERDRAQEGLDFLEKISA